MKGHHKRNHCLKSHQGMLHPLTAGHIGLARHHLASHIPHISSHALMPKPLVGARPVVGVKPITNRRKLKAFKAPQPTHQAQIFVAEEDGDDNLAETNANVNEDPPSKESLVDGLAKTLSDHRIKGKDHESCPAEEKEPAEKDEKKKKKCDDKKSCPCKAKEVAKLESVTLEKKKSKNSDCIKPEKTEEEKKKAADKQVLDACSALYIDKNKSSKTFKWKQAEAL